MLKKTEEFILKSAHKVEKGINEETLTEPIPKNFKSKNFETEPIKDNAPHHLISIIETVSIYSESESEASSNNVVSNKDKISNIEIISIPSDSGSETETEEPIFVPDENFSP